MSAAKENARLENGPLQTGGGNSKLVLLPDNAGRLPRRHFNTAAGGRQDKIARYSMNGGIFQEAKERVSVPEAARRLGLEPNSAGKIRCPFHAGDDTPSLQLYPDHWKCYGCGEHGDAVDLAARIRSAEPKEAAQWLLGESVPPSVTPPTPKAASDYGEFEREHVYPGGRVRKVFYRLNDGSKRAVWYHMDGGQWRKGKGDAPHVLYERGTPCADGYIVEGEKDVDNLFSLMGGYVVSGENGAGHGKWLPEYTKQLKAAGLQRAVIFSDNDEPGRAYAQETAAALHDVLERVKLVDLREIWPDMPGKADVSDFIAAHGETAKADLEKLARAAPEWTPPPVADSPAAESGFAPFRPFEKSASEALPEFPWEMLPPALQNMAETLSVFAETDDALAAVPALANCAVAIGRKFQVSPKPGWNEPLNLYALTAAVTGEGKSAVMNWLNRPLSDFQREWNREHAAIVDDYRDRLDVTEAEINATKTRIAKGKASLDDLSKLTERRRSLLDNPVRPLCLFAQDCTPEELEKLLADNGETMSVICDEGGIMETLTGGRYKDGVNLECLLNGFTGGTVQTNRVGRKAVSLENPCLTVNVMCQPVTVQDLISNATFNRRGLTGRFLYAFAPSKGGYRTGDKPEPWTDAVDAYNDLISALLGIALVKDAPPRVIAFSDEAYSAYLEFFAEKESLLRELDPDAPFRGWAARMHGHAVRLAGIFHVCAYRNEADAVPLSAETFQKAATLTRYFKAHAEYAFSLSGASATEAERDARYIWKRLSESGKAQFTKSDLNRLCKRFKTADERQPGLDELTQRGYIRIERAQTPGRPSETVFLNPKAQG